MSATESVWDYPRPPAVEAVNRTLEVWFAGVRIARTSSGLRVLETSHPPVYYFPPTDVDLERVKPALGTTTSCEWKGRARFYDVIVGEQLARSAAWCYPTPVDAFIPIEGYLAFYAGKMDRCLVGGVVAQPQPGRFYGGWITPELVGPFKGAPGTEGW